MLYSIVFLIILAISFLFSMLGLGGGMVYVPTLNWVGLPLKEIVIPLALILNVVTSISALLVYSKSKLVDWEGGTVMAGAALLMAPLGAFLSRSSPVKFLLVLFAAAVTVAAVRMVFFAAQAEPEELMARGKRFLVGGSAGTIAGLMSGMLGVGGGFIISPILMWMGYKTKKAAGTTAFVVMVSAASGFAGHLTEGKLDWGLTAIAVAAALFGAYAGALFMARKAKPNWVKSFYALVLFGIAIKLFLEVV